MNHPLLVSLAEQLASGRLSVPQFLQRVEGPGFAQFGAATLDLDRQRRCGYPEVVYGAGKDAETLIQIFQRLLEEGVEVLATRVAEEKVPPLASAFPAGRYNPRGRTFRVAAPGTAPPARRGRVAVVTAGTSDLEVAEEARETLDWMGVDVAMVHDVGVAGPHRLPAHLELLHAVDVVVVVAGMEGALPSVVGGYVACPVVAVPTSVGYGASLGGMTALLGMLNSCAANVTVVNIDAGFKGGYIAGLIAQRCHAPRDGERRDQPAQAETSPPGQAGEALGPDSPSTDSNGPREGSA